jgi:hypothetical protein
MVNSYWLFVFVIWQPAAVKNREQPVGNYFLQKKCCVAILQALLAL